MAESPLSLRGPLLFFNDGFGDHALSEILPDGSTPGKVIAYLRSVSAFVDPGRTVRDIEFGRPLFTKSINPKSGTDIFTQRAALAACPIVGTNADRQHARNAIRRFLVAVCPLTPDAGTWGFYASTLADHYAFGASRLIINHRDPEFRDIKLILIPATIHVQDYAGRIIAKCYKVAEQLGCPCLWTGE